MCDKFCVWGQGRLFSFHGELRARAGEREKAIENDVEISARVWFISGGNAQSFSSNNRSCTALRAWWCGCGATKARGRSPTGGWPLDLRPLPFPFLSLATIFPTPPKAFTYLSPPPTTTSKGPPTQMAFFGLTALGAQDPLAVSPEGIQHLHVFTDADWEASFRQVVQHTKVPNEEEGWPLAQLLVLMEHVYHGPVPPAEFKLLEKWVVAAAAPRPADGKNVPPFFTLPELLAAVHGARVEAERLVAQRKVAPGPSCETASWHDYARNVSKCKAARAPPQKQTVPLTVQQEIGWETPTFVTAATRVPKRSSEETKFASEMIKAGRFMF